jgi:hypothetical protein
LWDAIVSCCDTPQLLELSDGSLDAVSQFVFGRIECSFAGHAGTLRNDRLGSGRLDKVEDCVGVVSLVSDDVACLEPCQQGNAKLGIAGIAASEDEAHRPTERIDCDVPLGGQSSSGAPQSLVARPPFWPVAAWA